jgi:hypothetical protein
LNRAQKVVFNTASFDSSLILGSGLGIGKDAKFRGQKVLVEIQVPVGKRILFDESVEDKLNSIHVRIGERRKWRRNEWDSDWDDNYYFDWKSNTEYVMTDDDKLVEANRLTAPPSTGTYEYKKNGENVDSLRKAVDEQERKLQEDRIKLQEAERNRATTLKKAVKQETIQTALPNFSFFI